MKWDLTTQSPWNGTAEADGTGQAKQKSPGRRHGKYIDIKAPQHLLCNAADENLHNPRTPMSADDN